MLTHVVCFRFPEAASAVELQARLLSLSGRIPELGQLEVGLDIVRSERSYDLVLIARFEDRAGLEAYRVHPDHQEVVRFIREAGGLSVVVDYLT